MKSSTSDGPRFMSSLDDDTLKVTGWREEQLTQTRHRHDVHAEKI